MAWSIFDTDPDAAPKERTNTYEAPDFKLSGGKQNERGEPVVLDKWRFRLATMDLAESIAARYGGSAEETPGDTSDHPFSVESEEAALDLVMRAEDLHYDMKQFLGGQLVHHCDGSVFVGGDEDDIGRPCGCPPGFEDRKALAKKKRGPSPHITLNFRLADDLDLGRGAYTSSSWVLAKAIPAFERDLKAAGDQEVLVRATRRTIEGSRFTYTITELDVRGLWNDAIAG